jgi:S-DNA-T family DNA segregation ATPase FtsK/SpoIIIE
VPTALAATIQRRLTLRLADDSDYSYMGLPTDVLDRASPPGRGLIDGAEVQVAVLGDSGDVSQQAAAVRDLAETMQRIEVAPAPRIYRLTERVVLDDLPVLAGGLPTVGVASTTLDACGVEPRGTFLVAGPSGSGRTSVLQMLVSSLTRSRPDTTFHYVGTELSPLAGLPNWSSRLMTPEDVATGALQLTATLQNPGSTPGVVVIEGLPDFLGSPADFALQDVIKSATRHGHFVVCEGEISGLGGGMQLLVLARVSRAGICLQPDQSDAMTFRAEFPRYRRADFPVGRGVLVQRGVPDIVQFALPNDHTADSVMGSAPHGVKR